MYLTPDGRPDRRPRRVCYLCRRPISIHDKYTFDPDADSRPRHLNCNNPEWYEYPPATLEEMQRQHPEFWKKNHHP